MRDEDFERLYAAEAAGLFSFLAYRTGDRALAGLSAEEREAISLRYGSDLNVPEMAVVLGESLTTVEGRVYRALRKLREALGAKR